MVISGAATLKEIKNATVAATTVAKGLNRIKRNQPINRFTQ